MGGGTAKSAGKRTDALHVERTWAKEMRANVISAKQGLSLMRSGFAWKN